MAFYRKSLSEPAKALKNTKTLWPWLRLLLATGLVCVLGGIFAFSVLAAWVSRDLPDPNVLSTRQVAQSTKIFDRTGLHLLYEIHGDQNRTLVTIDQISPYAKNATIAIEDHNFYQHHGVYIKGLFRAAFDYLAKRRVEGASTLTQQLAKNTLLTRQRTFLRKVKEFVLALQIERQYSKDLILQMYLNQIPYGSTMYGIESAAQNYFGKSAKELSLDEAALLAGIPQRPDFYSPYGQGSRGDNRARLVVRQHYILDQMAEQGYITKDQASWAKGIDTLKKLKPRALGDIQAPHFVMYVRQQLVDKYGQQVVEQGGLKVTTTLDWDKQQAAEKAVKDGVDARGAKYHFTNAALISLDPTNGQILAMVGSRDFFDAAHDGQVNVTLRARQPGSSFKPIVYATGFMQGYLPATLLWDVETVFKTDLGTYQPHDYDLKERGLVSVRQALQGSLNIPAVKMLYLAGLPRVLDFADRLGYTTLQDRSRFGLSLVLGGGEVKPIEHASAYGAFAAEGMRYPTSAILQVDDAEGKQLESWTAPAGERVMDPQIARLISDVLSDNVARLPIFGSLAANLTLSDRPVAAKTGTTNNYHDAWTVGYTPQLVAAVWVGNNDNQELKRGADGSIVAAPIWHAYMQAATRGLPVMRFTPPDAPTTDKPILLGQYPQQTANIDKVSGKLATSLTPPEDVTALRVKPPHSILYFVDKEDPGGPVPTNPANDPQFSNWEAAVHDWAARHPEAGFSTTTTIPTAFDDIHTTSTAAQIGPPPAGTLQISLTQPLANQMFAPQAAFMIQPAISGPNPIVRVDAFLDGTFVGTSQTAPWIINLSLPNTLGLGVHSLKLTATDSLGQVAVSMLPIQVSPSL